MTQTGRPAGNIRYRVRANEFVIRTTICPSCRNVGFVLTAGTQIASVTEYSTFRVIRALASAIDDYHRRL